METTTNQNTLYKILTIFFKYADREVDEDLLYEIVTSHENPNSLLCLSDTLTDFNIYNVSARCNIEKLHELNKLSFLHVSIDGNKEKNDFYLLKEITTENVTLLDYRSKRLSFPLADFEQKWSGILVATEIAKTTLTSYSLRFFFKKTYQLFILFLIILSCLIFINPTTNYSFGTLILILKMVGCMISWLLIQKDYKIPNSFSDAVCSFSRKLDCDKVLRSKGAIFWGTHVSELAFYYFSISLLSLLTIYLTGNAQFFLVYNKIITYATAGFVVYTLFYQSVIIKSWCSLCLLLSTCVLAETAIFLLYVKGKLIIHIPTIFFVLLIGSLLLVILSALKTLYRRVYFYKKEYGELIRLKKKPNVLLAILQHKRIQNYSFDNTDIILGNENSSNTVIELINPYCKPCKRSFENIMSLLYIGNFKVVIRFSGIPLAGENIRYKTAIYLLSLYQELPKALFIEAMLKWYEIDNYEEFTKQFVLKKPHVNVNDVIDSQIRWAQQEDIRYTPAIIFNGYLCPTWLSMSDLKYYLQNFL